MRLAIGFAMVLASSLALGQGQDREYRQALNNLAHEQVICAAYMTVVNACLINAGEKALSEQNTKMGAALLQAALMVGAEAKLLPETTGARLKISIAKHQKAIANNCSNISILSAKYAYQCKALAEDPTKRGEELIDAEFARKAKRGPARK
jgi:hypothetical protein